MKKSCTLFLLGVLLFAEWAGAVFPVEYDSRKPEKFAKSFSRDGCKEVKQATTVSGLEARKNSDDLSLETVSKVAMHECFDVQGGGPRVILSLSLRSTPRVDIAFFASTSVLKFNAESEPFIEADGVSVARFEGKTLAKGIAVIGPMDDNASIRLYATRKLSDTINMRLRLMSLAAREVMFRVGDAIVALCDAKTVDQKRHGELDQARGSACEGIVRIPHSAAEARLINEAISGYVNNIYAGSSADDIDWSTIVENQDEHMLSYAWKMLLSWCRVSMEWQETLGSQRGGFSTDALEAFTRENSKFFSRLYPLIDRMLDHFNFSLDPEQRLSVFESFVKSGVSAYLPKSYAMMPIAASFSFIEFLSQNLPHAILLAVEVPPASDDDVVGSAPTRDSEEPTYANVGVDPSYFVQDRSPRTRKVAERRRRTPVEIANPTTDKSTDGAGKKPLMPPKTTARVPLVPKVRRDSPEGDGPFEKRPLLPPIDREAYKRTPLLPPSDREAYKRTPLLPPIDREAHKRTPLKPPVKERPLVPHNKY